jgi:hypothetical protein
MNEEATKKQLTMVDLSKLNSWSRKMAVLDYIRKNKKANNAPSYVIPPESLKKVFKGSWVKPWTWLDYSWEINDTTLDDLLK